MNGGGHLFFLNFKLQSMQAFLVIASVLSFFRGGIMDDE